MAHSTCSRVGNVCRRTRLTFLLTSIALLGCDSQDEIRHYSVPKPELVYADNHVDAGASAAQGGEDATEPTDRLLGAIVPREARTWYFKMTGPLDLVAQQEGAFRELVESLTFDGPDSPPKWTLPSSWEEHEGTGPRLATLSVEVQAQKLEVSVIQLPTSDSPASVLDNVNRWRDQMQLPPINQNQLETKTKNLTLSEGTAVYVNLVGNFSSSMGRPAMGAR